jgi:2-dehydro-3-deoxy-D-arabinonate dehydratase
LLANPRLADELDENQPNILGQEHFAFEDLDGPPAPERPHLLAPIDRQEVWAAGVTYLRSRAARVEESEAAANHYERVYDAPRPELFFKGTPHRTVGPNSPVRIRTDSNWNVPEPIYLESCALGPVVTLSEAVSNPQALSITMAVERGEEVIFSGQTSTSQMKRGFQELINYLGRANAFPDGVFLLTGTGIVPPSDFTLEDGDLVIMTIEAIGTLRNPVKRA